MARETNATRRRNAEDARQKAAAARAAAKRREQRRRLLVVLASAVGVLVIVGALVAVAVLTGGKKKVSNEGVANPQAVAAVTSVPASTIDAVGKGSPVSLPVKATDASALTANGKPEVLYVGGEFCPYCAGERWALIQALSRFGTWSGLTTITSSEDEIPTFTFRGASYTSDYLTFVGREISGQQHEALDKLSGDENKRFLGGTGGQGSFPFVDLGGKYWLHTQVDPAALSGKSASDVATALKDPSTKVSKAIVGTANTITAALCQLTGNQPADVCSASAVTALTSQIGK